VAAKVQAVNLTKVYRRGQELVYALNSASLEVYTGEMVALVGRPGSGKSVLLGILGCLQRPDSGRLSIDEQEVSQLTDNELAWVRISKVGFLPQDPNLKPNDTALANVEAALIGLPLEERERRQKAWAAIRLVGIEQRVAEQKLGLLSRGQRVGIGVARALVNDPPLFLADAPMKGLDSVARQEALDVFQKLNDSGRTIIIATSDSSVSNYCRRVVRIAEGRIVDDGPVSRRRIVTPSGISAPGLGTSIMEELSVCPRCNYGNPKGQPNCQRCNDVLQSSPAERLSPVTATLPRVAETDSQVAEAVPAESLSGAEIDSIVAGQRATTAPTGAESASQAAETRPAVAPSGAEIDSQVAEARPAVAPSGAESGSQVAETRPAAAPTGAEIDSQVAETRPAVAPSGAEIDSQVAEARPASAPGGAEINPQVAQDYIEIDEPGVPPQEIMAELKKIPFFARMGTRSLTKLMPLLEQRRYRKGSRVVIEGDVGDSYYVIRKGDAQVVAKGEGEGEMPIAQLGPLEGFGEMALLTDEPRYATVIALTELDLWRVSKTSFEELLSADPSLVVYFNEILRQRIMELNERRYPSA